MRRPRRNSPIDQAARESSNEQELTHDTLASWVHESQRLCRLPWANVAGAQRRRRLVRAVLEEHSVRGAIVSVGVPHWGLLSVGAQQPRVGLAVFLHRSGHPARIFSLR